MTTVGAVGAAWACGRFPAHPRSFALTCIYLTSQMCFSNLLSILLTRDVFVVGVTYFAATVMPIQGQMLRIVAVECVGLLSRLLVAGYMNVKKATAIRAARAAAEEDALATARAARRLEEGTARAEQKTE
ncbi:unnamed protein product [Cuscuta campestris]|uniref:Uncharacterized protein n=1 Tax=Cuscuta campestris TaxID=132261 RepID=A0A484MU80_9ASTE|nr:unnamed protein product [Cuscuta campestris]